MMRENLRVSTSCIGFLAGKIQLIKQRAQKEAELAAAISQKWFSYLDNRKKTVLSVCCCHFLAFLLPPRLSRKQCQLVIIFWECL